jgi:hypothetical protein
MWRAGLLLGAATGCRPHLALGAAFAGLMLLLLRRPLRQIIVFAPPVLACGLATAGYNYARFGNPLEFGLRYQLTGGESYRNVSLSLRNMGPGLYHMLFSPPEWDGIFPFIHLPWRPEYTLSKYFLEPVAGAIAICPVLMIALFAPLLIRRMPRETPVRAVLWAMYLTGICGMLFITATGLSSQRFEVDFTPYLFPIACVLGALLLKSLRTRGAFAALLVYGILAHIAITITGPDDGFMKAQPAAYVRLAKWYSPIERNRPQLDPKLSLDSVYENPSKVLFAAGRFGSRYELNAQPAGEGKLLLVSTFDNLTFVKVEVPLAPGANRAHAEYTPEDHTMTVTWNGVQALKHPLGFLVTAPGEVVTGGDKKAHP